MGHFVDVKAWKRRDHFLLYRTYAQPFFGVCVEVDATNLWRRSRAPDGPSFFLAALFLLLQAANDVQALRLRLRKRGVWRHDRVAVGTTILKRDETFGFARLDLTDSFQEFQVRSEREIARVKSEKKLLPASQDDDLMYHSSLPWLRFTAFTNAITHADSTPRIVFGRCVRDGRSARMPVAVEVHHALVDGLDVARLLERFEAGLSSFRP